jgi:hypothetical protein
MYALLHSVGEKGMHQMRKRMGITEMKWIRHRRHV